MERMFDFRRTGLLLRADFMEYGRGWLFSMGILFLTWVVALVFIRPSGPATDIPLPVDFIRSFAVLGSVVAFILVCHRTGYKLHNTRGAYLLVPAGSGEKYLSIIIEGVIAFAAVQVIVWLGIFIIQNTFPFNGVEPGFYSGVTFAGVAKGLFLVSFVLFFYVRFPKSPVLIMLFACTLYMFLNVFILIKIHPLLPTIFNVYVDNGGRLVQETVNGKDTYITHAGEIIKDCAPYVLFVAALVIQYVIYLKVKEKEIK